ncbi:hypothetical protein [Prevotella intermedia]|nr:hypothetical protein [Prevotella intermedia]MCK6143374.1 hypothetical protein [Prevotella intermedia]
MEIIFEYGRNEGGNMSRGLVGTRRQTRCGTGQETSRLNAEAYRQQGRCE